MSWTIQALRALEAWREREDPVPHVFDDVLWRWLIALEEHGPFSDHLDVGVVLYADETAFIALQLPDHIARGVVAEGFADEAEQFMWVTIMSGVQH